MDQNQKTLQQKITIAEAAASLYDEHEENFTFHEISEKTDITVGEIFNYFNDKQEIFCFYYSSLVIRYRLMIDEIDSFRDYTLSEKLSNFAYASFDMMSEHELFVKNTFKSRILCSFKSLKYKNHIQTLLKGFFEHDNLTSASGSHLINDYTMRLLTQKYLLLVLFWLNDESDNKEATMELTDKLTGLLQEIMYTSVADRSIDLAKFLYSNRMFSCNNTFYNKMRSTFEFR